MFSWQRGGTRGAQRNSPKLSEGPPAALWFPSRAVLFVLTSPPPHTTRAPPSRATTPFGSQTRRRSLTTSFCEPMLTLEQDRAPAADLHHASVKAFAQVPRSDECLQPGRLPCDQLPCASGCPAEREGSVIARQLDRASAQASCAQLRGCRLRKAGCPHDHAAAGREAYGKGQGEVQG